MSGNDDDNGGGGGENCPTWFESGYCDCEPDNCVMWGVPWEFLVISITVFVLGLLANFVIALLFWVVERLLKNKLGRYLIIVRRELEYWTVWLFRVGMFWLAYTQLQIPEDFANVLDHFVSIPFVITWLLWTNALFNAITGLMKEYIHRAAEEEEDTDKAPPMTMDQLGKSSTTIKSDKSTMLSAYEELLRIIKYVAFIIIVIIGLSIQGLDVVDFLQSAALFSLVLVFSCQPWLRNLVGGTVIFFDGKFRVGDDVRVLGVEGQVEQVTLRTTLLRRNDQSLAFVPNSRVMEQPVSNFSARRKRLLEARIHLSHFTPVEKIRHVLRELDGVLQTLHPDLTSHISNKPRGDGINSSAGSGSGAGSGAGSGPGPRSQEFAKKSQHGYSVDASRETMGNHATDLQDHKKFFVVLDGMYEILIWAYSSEIDNRATAVIRSEIMLAAREVLTNLGVKTLGEDFDDESDDAGGAAGGGGGYDDSDGDGDGDGYSDGDADNKSGRYDKDGPNESRKHGSQSKSQNQNQNQSQSQSQGQGRSKGKHNSNSSNSNTGGSRAHHQHLAENTSASENENETGEKNGPTPIHDMERGTDWKALHHEQRRFQMEDRQNKHAFFSHDDYDDDDPGELYADVESLNLFRRNKTSHIGDIRKVPLPHEYDSDDQDAAMVTAALLFQSATA